MAQHTILLEAFYDGDWHAVPTYNRDEVRVTSGRQDQLQRLSPSEMTVTINNRDGVYSPRNPESPLYGKIGRNTRVRLTVDGGVEFVGEVESWPVRWDKSGQDKWVRIVARGPLYRLGLPGSLARVKSPLRRWFEQQTSPAPVAWWHMEDGADRTQAESGLGGPSLSLVGGAQGGDTLTAPGAASAVRVVGGWASSNFSRGSYASIGVDDGGAIGYDGSTGELVIDLIVCVDLSGGSVPQTATGMRMTIEFISPETLNLLISANSNLEGFRVFASSGGGGDSAIITSTLAQTVLDGRPHHLRLVGADSAGTLTFEVFIDGVSAGTDTATPTDGMPAFDAMLLPTQVVWTDSSNQPVADVAATFSHLALWDTVAAPSPYEASTGYAGEQAHERIERVGSEEGIPVTILGGSAGSERMGPQPYTTPLEVIYDCEHVDMGMLFELVDDFGLGYRTRASMYNLDPTLTLTYGQGEIASFEPSEDLDLVQNDVTVRRPGGSSARAVQETGPLNVQEPTDDPQGVGRFPVDVEVNVASDGQLAGQAGWRRHVAVDRARWGLALHEAGHAVVACHFGVEIHHSAIVASGVWRHPDVSADQPHGVTVTRESGDAWTDALIAAGGMATTLRTSMGGIICMHDPSPVDQAEIIALVGAGRELAAIKEAHAVLKARERALEAVAHALYYRGSLSGQRVVDIVRSAEVSSHAS
jgi:hypothetical protein